MGKSRSRAIIEILLKFTRLNEAGQTMFISRMNEFLLASCRRRRLLVEQWESELAPTAKSLSEDTHADLQQ